MGQEQVKTLVLLSLLASGTMGLVKFGTVYGDRHIYGVSQDEHTEPIGWVKAIRSRRLHHDRNAGDYHHISYHYRDDIYGR